MVFIKKMRKHSAFQFLFDWALALLLASYVNCQFEFHLGILMKIVGQICHGEFFMHMPDRVTLKKWKAAF